MIGPLPLEQPQRICLNMSLRSTTNCLENDDITKGKHLLLLTLCVGNSRVTSEVPSQRPVIRSFDVFFDLCLNKWLSKQSIRWWFQTPALWRHCNGIFKEKKWRVIKWILIAVVCSESKIISLLPQRYYIILLRTGSEMCGSLVPNSPIYCLV